MEDLLGESDDRRERDAGELATYFPNNHDSPPGIETESPVDYLRDDGRGEDD